MRTEEQLHNDAARLGCDPRLLRLVDKAAVSKAPERRNSLKPKWPGASWMNAFAVQEAHDLDVMRLETEAMVAVFGDRRTA